MTPTLGGAQADATGSATVTDPSQHEEPGAAPGGVGAVAPNVTTVRRAQILCAAIQVVGRKGALGARLKDIAREADVSLGLVQHYFGTRDELMEHTFRMMLSISLDRVRAVEARDPDPLHTLVSMLRLHAYGSVDFAERWGFWVEMWSSARRDPALAEIARTIYELWTVPFESTIRRLQQEGRCRTDISAAAAAVLIMGLIDGLAVRSLVDPTTLTVDQVYSSLFTASFAVLGIAAADQQEALSRVGGVTDAATTSAPLSVEVVQRFLTES
ncbi:MAG: TetR family transcriptional regulator C-terminal domain-containing protein [Nitriliruptoraceae bacterium]|nr:TetR family transcriptional regulator C-terminal domain-containing protein [Nitriliruptoraceae bacterium]